MARSRGYPRVPAPARWGHVCFQTQGEFSEAWKIYVIRLLKLKYQHTFIHCSKCRSGRRKTRMEVPIWPWARSCARLAAWTVRAWNWDWLLHPRANRLQVAFITDSIRTTRRICRRRYREPDQRRICTHPICPSDPVSFGALSVH